MRGVIYLQACTLMHNINMFHMLEDINRAAKIPLWLSKAVRLENKLAEEPLCTTSTCSRHSLQRSERSPKPLINWWNWQIWRRSILQMFSKDKSMTGAVPLFKVQRRSPTETKRPLARGICLSVTIVHDELSKGFQLVAEPMLSLRGE